jgi:hypothetical protein
MELAELVAKYQQAGYLIMFAWLMKYVLDQNAKRETQFMQGFEMLKNAIDRLTTRFDDLKDEVRELREKVG